MTINIHNNHNKLSIVGDANWQVGTVGADLAGGARSNLAICACKNVTNIHFIIIYISTAWQGEGKISKNVTNILFIIIYIS